MKTIRIATLAALVVAPAVGLAAPASAELTDGTYQQTFIGESTPPKTMVVSPCGAGCKHAQVAGAAASLDFHLDGSTWTASMPSGSAVTIDNDSLAGSFDGDAFQLVKVG